MRGRLLVGVRTTIAGAGAVLALVLTWSGSAAAQDATGQLEGRIVTPDAPSAAGVRVTASGPSLQLTRVVETDPRGNFRITALPVGLYQVRLALIGYRPMLIDSVTVRLGRTTSLGLTSLTAQALELGEMVVYATHPLVDVSSPAVVTNIPSEVFTSLPTDRNFRSIVTLAPQANQSLFPNDEANVAGSSGAENAYFVDGVNITNPVSAQNSVDLPYNFVRELQVKAGGYQAEYGRATGGIVDVITHSGGNRFGGQLFGFFTNNGLMGTPQFAVAGATQTAFSDYDFGGSLGGPIVRDHLWFFAAYDPTIHREGVQTRGPVLPDDRKVTHLFATKLTWRPAPSTDVLITVHGDPYVHRSTNALGQDSVVNADAVTAAIRGGGLVLSGLLRQRLGRATQAEVGVARVTRGYIEMGQTALGRGEPKYIDFHTGEVVASGGHKGSAREDAVRTSFRGSLSAVLGRHTAKVGVEYEDNLLNARFDFSGPPATPLGVIYRRDDTTWFWDRSLDGGKFHNRIPTVYAQDSWRLGTRLTLDAGLRWEGQYLSHAGGQVVQNFTDEWQPRLGFVYQLGEPGTQTVSGSYGRFFEQIPQQFEEVYYSDFASRSLVQFNHDPRIDPTGGDTLKAYSSRSTPQHRPYLKGQYFDAFTLGYDRAVGHEFRLGVHGMYRTLRWAIEDVFDSASDGPLIGNPGRGAFAFAPRARHTYTALVLTFEKPSGRRLAFLVSYVLSRTFGNYDGLYDYQQMESFPNESGAFDSPAQFPNSTGLLSNDRTHVLKLSGSYRFDFGLTAGTAIAWMSGTPRNEEAQTDLISVPFFLRPRGSVGRAPALFDASLRLTYDLPVAGTIRPKVSLDLFHIGNRRTPAAFDDVHYQEVDSLGNLTTPNPNYHRPTLFQPPMSARLGITIDFGRLD
ncbi:MAG: TonB-dependent receptor [Gemmatimonadales bacterium]